MDTGTIGAIAGAIIGLLGSFIGVYCSISQSKSEDERQYVIKSSVVFTFGVLAFLGLLFYLPKPYNHLIWIPYSILLPISIKKMNKRIEEIRNKETKM
ncbi:hypothetical protein LNTAR_21640 [Lentisphaera araneosa HTCC2155]|uniref:Uncharacterized protein n=1 Tax=Lentisphaera araneosa HTCC2155 TaxID=313628 RepID=A6DM62_9BACT|nr:hypothetical protein [Lentisphaera araneosa]EDM25964.1 hypothetical protein LNTAR_19242 [Lentisphaera araneosa HTCC2155]EDM27360.1 hypothetical protein LNTAR_21640 [Lentisphaera araneosa HTCC2155]